MLFCAEKDTPKDWINLGRSLECFLLKTTEIGVSTAFINQPCEVEILSEQMQRELLNNKKLKYRAFYSVWDIASQCPTREEKSA